MRKYFGAVAGGAMFFAMACGSAPAPSTPSALPAISGTVTSLKVTGPPLVVGDALQFSAIATMADGTSQQVTSLSSWTSSNPSIATVSTGGVVTAIKEGGVSIRATFGGATDSEYHNVTPLLFFRTTGTVTDRGYPGPARGSSALIARRRGSGVRRPTAPRRSP